MVYCHFELCRDCRLGCFSELLLADIWRLWVVAVVFLYQITFLQQNTTASLLELYFNDSMQTVYARGGGGCGSRQRQVADGTDVVFTDTHCNGQCNSVRQVVPLYVFNVIIVYSDLTFHNSL